ncbi:MAG: M48 family metalloprotease [SAR324 cluster bacterium]|nr:M48 family metalloprotease [SAR324 cluster bacterium]
MGQFNRRFFALFIFFCFSTTLVYGGNRKEIKQNRPPAEYSKKSIKSEISFGRNLAAKLLANETLSSQKRLTEYVALIGRGLAENIGRPELNYYFGVVQSDNINAYALPGGYIFITSKAIELMKNEAELVGVLAHEIAHVNRRHVLKAVKFKSSENELFADAEILVGGGVFKGLQTIDVMMDKAFQVLFDKGLEEHYEFEADRLALDLMQVVEYNPKAYVDYLKVVAQNTKQSSNSIYTKTHPPLSSRIRKLEGLLKGMESTDDGTINEKRFKKYVR